MHILINDHFYISDGTTHLNNFYIYNITDNKLTFYILAHLMDSNPAQALILTSQGLYTRIEPRQQYFIKNNTLACPPFKHYKAYRE